jgi:hypothetical protein
MVQVDKFIKSRTNKSKANKLVSKIKKIQALDKKSYDMLIFSFQPLER